MRTRAHLGLSILAVLLSAGVGGAGVVGRAPLPAAGESERASSPGAIAAQSGAVRILEQRSSKRPPWHKLGAFAPPAAPVLAGLPPALPALLLPAHHLRPESGPIRPLGARAPPRV